MRESNNEAFYQENEKKNKNYIPGLDDGSELQKELYELRDSNAYRTESMQSDSSESEYSEENDNIISTKTKNINKLNEGRNSVDKNKPKKRDKQLDDYDEVQGMLNIEAKLNQVSADTSRAALFYKVRDAVKLYRKCKNDPDKHNMLLAIRECAANYLREKKGKATGNRREICRDLVDMIDKHVEATGMSAERSVDYLFTMEDKDISDEQLNMELILAGKLTKNADDPFDGNLKDRRKAFKRKKKDTLFLQKLVEEMNVESSVIEGYINKAEEDYRLPVNERNEEYDDASNEVTIAYAKLHNLNEEDTKKLIRKLSARDDNKEGVRTKGHMIESLLMEILSWDLKDFAFKNPEDFLHRRKGNTDEKTHFKNLMTKLNFAVNAVPLVTELGQLREMGRIDLKLDKAMIDEIGARISLLSEIHDEYVQRMEIMSSPYYALLLQEDTERFKDSDKLNELLKDRAIPETDKKTFANGRFRYYVEKLGEKKDRLESTKKTGREFTRKSDPEKLLKIHRRYMGAAVNFDKRNIDHTNRLLSYDLHNDEVFIKKVWAKEELELEREKEGEENDVRKDSLPLEGEVAPKEPDEVDPEVLEAARKRDKDELDAKLSELRKAAKDAELNEYKEKIKDAKAVIQREKEEAEQREAERKAKFRAEIEREAALVHEKRGAKIAALDKSLDESARKYIAEVMEKEEIERQIRFRKALEEELANSSKEMLEKSKKRIEAIEKDIDAAQKKRIEEAMKAENFEYFNDVFEMEEADKELLDKMDLSAVRTIRILAEKVNDSDYDAEAGETWESVGEEQRLQHREDCAELLSHFMNADIEDFALLPIDELSQFAYDAVQGLVKEKSTKTIKSLNDVIKDLKERVKETKALADKFEKTAESMDRKDILALLKEYTGKEEKDLSDIPTVELADLIDSLTEDVGDLDELKKSADVLLGTIVDLHGEEYYRERFLEYRGDLAKIEDSGTKDKYTARLIKSAKLSVGEYKYLYFKSILKDVKKEDIDKLSDDDAYTIIQYYGVIKGIGAETTDEYEKKDRNIALKAISSLKLSKELKDTLNTAFAEEIKADKEAFKTAPVKKAKVKMFADVDNKNIIREEKTVYEPGKNYNEYINKKIKEHGEKIQRTEEELQEDKALKTRLDKMVREKNLGKNKVINEEKEWSKDAKVLLDFVGDLANATATEGGLKKLLSSRFGYVKALKKNPALLDELIAKAHTEEKELMQGMKNAILSDNPEAGINKTLKAFEEKITKTMEEATKDIFDTTGDTPFPDLIITEQKQQNEADKTILRSWQNDALYNNKYGQGKFVQTLVSGYYQNASKKDRANMLSYIIKDLKGGREGMTEKQKGGEYFASTLKGAGPLMQKIIQGVPERMVIPEMRPAISVVKSNLGSIDKAYVDQVFEEMKTDSKGKITSITDIKPLGAASIAETFMCTVSGKKKEPTQVVVKIRRPGVYEYMKSEETYIKKCAMFADMTDDEIAAYKKKETDKNAILPHQPRVTESGLIAQLQEIEKEFDFMTEIKNAKRGEKNYIDAGRKVNTVKINDSFKEKSHYMVMNKADGVTVDRFINTTREHAENESNKFLKTDQRTQGRYAVSMDNYMELGKSKDALRKDLEKTIKYERMVSDLAYVWVRQALFGSFWLSYNGDNFHHGDLHSGNIMISDKGTTVIDYGNAAVFKDDRVTEILAMMAAVLKKKEDVFINAFDKLIEIGAKKDNKENGGKLNLQKMTEDQKKAYAAELKKIFEIGTPADAGIKILVALSTAQKLGIKLPLEIQNFSQCEQRLENSLLEVKKTALDLQLKIEEMDRMPVEFGMEETIDPLMRLQHRLSQKDELTKKYEDKRTAIDNLLKDYPEETVASAGESMAAINSKEMTKEEFIEKHLPAYKAMQKDPLPENLGEQTKNWRAVFYELKALRDKGEEVPKELMNKVEECSLEITTFLLTNPVMDSIGDRDDYMTYKSYSINNNEPEPDAEYFEKLMLLFEKILPLIKNAGDKLDLVVKGSSLREGSLVMDSITKLSYIKITSSPAVEKVIKRLRESKNGPEREQFEKELNNLSAKQPSVKIDYDSYRKVQEKYDKAVLEGDEKNIKKLEKSLADKEEMFITNYVTSARIVLLEEKERAEREVEMIADLNIPGYEAGKESKALDADLDDFVDVMGKVINKRWCRTLKKLKGRGLMTKAEEKEIDKKAKEEEEEEKKKKAKKK